MTCRLIPTDLPFYSYGVLMVFAFVAGIALFAYNSRRCKIRLPDLVDLSLVMVLPSLLGARVTYILLFPAQFSSVRDYFALHEGGLVFFGALVTLIPAFVIYTRLKKLDPAVLSDFMVPSLAAGHAIGRIGCLINGCCYGVHTDLLHIYRLHSDATGCYRHPTQLYEMIFLTALSIYLSFLLKTTYQKTPLKKGIISAYYLIAYSFFRFLIEFIRGDERGGFFTCFHFSPSQLIASALLLCGAVWLIYCHKNSVDSGVNSYEQS